jgi:hypothetical protein
VLTRSRMACGVASQLHSEPSHQLKAVIELPMAKLAARLLHPYMTIYRDTRTSTREIVPFIKALSGMTVVTNAFDTEGRGCLTSGALVASSSKYGTFSMYKITGGVQLDIISGDALPAADSTRNCCGLLMAAWRALRVSERSSPASTVNRPTCCRAACIRTLPNRHSPTDRSTRTDRDS